MCNSLYHPFRRAPEDNKSSDAGQYFTLESQHSFLKISALDNLSWGCKLSIFRALKKPWASSLFRLISKLRKQKKVTKTEALSETLSCSCTLSPTDFKAPSTPHAAAQFRSAGATLLKSWPDQRGIPLNPTVHNTTQKWSNENEVPVYISKIYLGMTPIWVTLLSV